MTESDLLKQIRNGSTHLFSEIVEAYKDRILSMAYKFTGNYHDAEDIAQEVFLKLFNHLERFQEGQRLSTWIYKISYNACIDWTRKNKRHRTAEYDDAAAAPADNIDIEKAAVRNEERKLLLRELFGMKEKYSGVLILRYLEELSIDEIEAVLDVPRRTVETRLYRARKILKDRVQQLLGDNGS